MQQAALSNKFIYVLFAELVLLFGGIIFVTRGLENLKLNHNQPSVIRKNEGGQNPVNQSNNRTISPQQ